MNATNEDRKEQYVEGDRKTRIVFFAFLSVWIIGGLLLRWLTEEKLSRISEVAESNPQAAHNSLVDISLWYSILPMSFFFLVQGGYLLWMGVKTFRTGIHPPTGTKVPFRAKARTGIMARIIAAGYFFAGICNLAIVALFFTLTNRI